MTFTINKYTNYCWLRVQTYMQEMHNFWSVKSIENRSLFSGYRIQENVTFIYSINNVEI